VGRPSARSRVRAPTRGGRPLRSILVGAFLGAALVNNPVRGLSVTSAYDSLQRSARLISDPVTVRVRIDTRYADDSSSMDALGRYIKALPPLRITVGPEDTLSGLIVRTYGFGPKDSPKAYSLIERTIVDWNELPSPSRISAGTILVPGLPRRAWTRPNPAKILNAVPKLVIGSTKVVGESITLFEYNEFAASRPAAQSADVVFALPRTGVKALEDSNVGFAVLSAPLQIDLSQGTSANVASDDDLEVVQTFAKSRQAIRPAMLYVLDTGWPTRDDMRDAIEYMNTVINDIRSAMGLPTVVIAVPSSFTDPYPHCSTIKRALSAFATVGVSGVDTVFLPLSRDQSADGLIREVLTLANLFDAVPRAIIAHPSEVQTDAQKASDLVMQGIQQTITAEYFNTDQRLIDAYNMVLQNHAERVSQYFVENYSWVVKDSALHVISFSQPRGLFVCASGNRRKDLHDDPVDFASRAYRDHQYVAVAFGNSAGEPECDSSFFNITLHPDAALVSYDGQIDDTCGSSFAAPRVAWLLALIDSRRPAGFSPLERIDDINDRLRRARKGPLGRLDLRSLFH